METLLLTIISDGSPSTHLQRNKLATAGGASKERDTGVVREELIRSGIPGAGNVGSHAQPPVCAVPCVECPHAGRIAAESPFSDLPLTVPNGRQKIAFANAELSPHNVEQINCVTPEQPYPGNQSQQNKKQSLIFDNDDCLDILQNRDHSTVLPHQQAECQQDHSQFLPADHHHATDAVEIPTDWPLQGGYGFLSLNPQSLPVHDAQQKQTSSLPEMQPIHGSGSLQPTNTFFLPALNGQAPEPELPQYVLLVRTNISDF